jgi:rhamnogalacturonan endolyase
MVFRIAVVLCLLGFMDAASLLAEVTESPAVTASDDPRQIVIDNGIVSLTVSKRNANVSSIKCHNGGRVIELTDARTGLYLDANAGPTDAPDDEDNPKPKAGYAHPLRQCRLITSGPEMAEVELEGQPTEWFPFRTEAHIVLPRGQSGFYAYAVYQHGQGMPAATLGQTRFVIRGPAGTSLFTHHVVDDQRQGPFPTSPIVSQVQDATYRLRDGTIYTKYNNSAFTSDFLAYGMAGHDVGLWMIWPSTEFCNGGPLRQDLTVHMDNILLAMFQSGHFGAGSIRVKEDEVWNKICGPVFVYINGGASVDAMWNDARQRAQQEQIKWPYTWLKRPDYPLHRGTVTGRVRLADGANVQGAWAILCPPGTEDWALSANGYMFWTKADAAGRFLIPAVRPGSYRMIISGANQFEDFQRADVTVKPGPNDLGDVAWQPVTHGQTLWQIGTADRSTREFKDGDNIRHYGNFLRYPDNFPDDVNFVVGKSKESQDWNFAQWSWYAKKPVWMVQFDCPRQPTGKATLTLGFASAQVAGELRVAVNDHEVARLDLPKSGAAGYRSGGQDSTYTVRYVTFDASLLKPGQNQITLGHTRAVPFSAPPERRRVFGQVMYDAIRLEVQP